jgi:hypothetical protein
MKIVIEFDETTSVFTANFDRGAISSATPGSIIPPPPFDDQIAEMSKWLAQSYPSILAKMKDSEISGVRLSFQATPK